VPRDNPHYQRREQVAEERRVEEILHSAANTAK
jgi:hypothetical protein